jgi:hypothetical protein
MSTTPNNPNLDHESFDGFDSEEEGITCPDCGQVFPKEEIDSHRQNDHETRSPLYEIGRHLIREVAETQSPTSSIRVTFPEECFVGRLLTSPALCRKVHKFPWSFTSCVDSRWLEL